MLRAAPVQLTAAGWQASSGHPPNLPLCVPCPSILRQIGPDYIGFTRPLLFNVSTVWRPTLYGLDGFTRSLCGVEHLTIAFPWSPYNGMNRELGLNALQFWMTPNSWVDDVAVVNAGVWVAHVVVGWGGGMDGRVHVLPRGVRKFSVFRHVHMVSINQHDNIGHQNHLTAS